VAPRARCGDTDLAFAQAADDAGGGVQRPVAQGFGLETYRKFSRVAVSFALLLGLRSFLLGSAIRLVYGYAL
jgi:hypothetical protein